MLRVSGVAPAPSGHEWRFQCSVGVDCSDAEPRCIWLAVLRGVSPHASPRPTPIASPRRRGSRRVIQRHRLSWAKGRRDGMLSSNENRRRPLSSGEVEGVSWQGPRTIFVQKNSQGFGFTLRHFIVYPPESSLHSLKDEENGNATGKAGCQRSRLEPMDTIFVKSVKEDGPAQQAGLCTGDRLVKVNGETILGKTYSQVIALIQNSENILELAIMPKDEDVLQLAYSQDAYLKGNEPYSGEAQNLPVPPPLCYPPTKPSSTAPQPSHSPHSPLDNWQCRPGPAASPLDNRPPGASPLTPGWSGGPEDSGGHFAAPGRHRGRSSSAINVLDFHFANHNAAIASATLPPPRKSSLPASARSQAETLCHQALSDWYYSQAEAAESMSPRHRSISQDCLAELGLGLALRPGPTSASTTTVEQRRRETLLYQHQAAAAASHDSYWLGGWGGVSGPGSKSCSESLLAAYAEYEHNYGRSVETLAQASALVSPRYDHSSQGSQMAKFREQKDQKVSAGHQHKTTVMSPITASSTVPPSGRQSGQQVAEPQTRRVKEEELVGYKSYSPSFSRKAGHLLQQAHSFREPGYCGPHLNWSPGSRSSPADSEGGVAPRPQSTPALSASEEERARQGEERELISPISLNQDVVLRQKPPSGRRTPVQAVRHPYYTTPAESPEPPGLEPARGTPSPVSGEPGTNRRANGSLAQHAFNSLSSIPFIDDPTSPSIDLQACYVPARSVVSSSQASTMATLTSTPVSPTLSSISPFVRLRAKDCSSIKGRRSSYLLAITTERSKSCDEGLNNFREEGRVFSKLPKRVKSFFTDGSLESLRAQEEAQSKRHSTSELGTITFSDVRKEGWLHYKQILTEKGKKVGGGMRPWKRVFSVLRSHSLFLYKDKREAVLHGAGAGSSQDEHPPISIRGCLIDIAYSETKRKHTLRLTTQDFCEYLLQAEDRDDMLAWIRVIRENSKTDNEEISFSRQALINKKLNDYRKHSLTGSKPDTSPKAHRMMPPFLLAKTDNTSVNRASRTDDNKALWGINIMKKAKKTGSPKAFGVRLEDCQPAVNHKFVPLIVEMCCGVVEETGLDYTGIYRVPGNNAMVSNLQEHLNKGMDINTAEERWQDLNVISSLLKSFFRKLPEPLFTDDKYNDFIDANRIEDAEDRLKTMKKLIHDLPDHYYHTLKFLVGHLKKVADHSESNKMEPRNIALVFGPTLVRTSEDNMTDMVTHMPDRYKIVETLILHHDWFFTNGELDKEEKAPEDKRDFQPVPNIDHLLSNIGRPGMPGEASDSTTSDSLKSKLSSLSKKDLNARDFLPKSIISAVTRKRKKSLSTHQQGGSADEDSDHEPVKTSNLGGAEEGGVEEAEDGREEKAINKEHTVNKKEKWDEKETGVKARETSERKDALNGEGKAAEEEAEKDPGNRTGNGARNSKKETRRRMTLPGNATQPRPNSALYSHHQVNATYPRPPTVANPPSHLSPRTPTPRGHPTAPFWICPTRLPNHSSSFYGTQQADWNQSVPVRYRKTRGGRTRAVSMNLDLELCTNEERVRGWRADRVEVVRVVEGTPAQHGCVGVPQGSVVGPGLIQQMEHLPRLAQESSPLSSSSGWVDQSSPGSHTVVLRRSGLDPRDKTRAWRRHTVVV
ncbi:rho GTPase-activating protein 23-like isoform X2 [Centropristis striata]|uniref:rho GTPase-activating protein 23-like isoform X2 n=1 Tax=Centropristis striata TaxID=184440 RepID=UPI0027DF42C5|nr:rho GTPase-activating protein 23-like isoform X2 [Centropristis striata]